MEISLSLSLKMLIFVHMRLERRSLDKRIPKNSPGETHCSIVMRFWLTLVISWTTNIPANVLSRPAHYPAWPAVAAPLANSLLADQADR